MSGRTAPLRHRSRSRSPLGRLSSAGSTEVSQGLLPTPQGSNSSDTGLNSKALYLSYPRALDLPSDAHLRRVFLRYGPIARVYAHRTPRVYVIVDYEKASDALKALSELWANDKDGSRRQELGDSRLTISFKTEKPREQKPAPPLWRGELSLAGHAPVPVTASLVEGTLSSLLCSPFVAISHRSPITEVLAHDPIAVLVFTGASDQHKKALSDLAEYFYFKQRAGVACLQTYAMYILPPGPESFRFTATLESHQLLGVVTTRDFAA